MKRDWAILLTTLCMLLCGPFAAAASEPVVSRIDIRIEDRGDESFQPGVQDMLCICVVFVV